MRSRMTNHLERFFIFIGDNMRRKVIFKICYITVLCFLILIMIIEYINQTRYSNIWEIEHPVGTILRTDNSMSESFFFFLYSFGNIILGIVLLCYAYENNTNESIRFLLLLVGGILFFLNGLQISFESSIQISDTPSLRAFSTNMRDNISFVVAFILFLYISVYSSLYRKSRNNNRNVRIFGFFFIFLLIIILALSIFKEYYLEKEIDHNYIFFYYTIYLFTIFTWHHIHDMIKIQQNPIINI